MGGALVRCETPTEPHEDPLRIEFRRDGEDIMLLGLERGRQAMADGSALIRLQFAADQEAELARMACSLFGSVHPVHASSTDPVRVFA